MMNAVGGTSIHYHAQSWRYSPWDFKVRSESIRRYGANSIPKGSTLEDWPLTYDDLENYYDIVEHEVGVSGRAGNIAGKLDPRGNVFEGAAQTRFSDASAARYRVHRHDDGVGEKARLEAVSRTCRDQFRALPRTARAAPITAIATAADAISAPRIRPR